MSVTRLHEITHVQGKSRVFQRQLNQARFVRRDFETMEWNPAPCFDDFSNRMFQCRKLGSYAVFFVSMFIVMLFQNEFPFCFCELTNEFVFFCYDGIMSHNIDVPDRISTCNESVTL